MASKSFVQNLTQLNDLIAYFYSRCHRTYIHRGVGRGGLKGSDEPLSSQDFKIASYRGGLDTKCFQV